MLFELSQLAFILSMGITAASQTAVYHGAHILESWYESGMSYLNL